ncbi:MAG: MerR family transcriptional regulator [Oscillospiraceae bacterium]|jgi:DNA-binding transcriptional MerR regulator|nr:MerR family transcriptional regulator [Oscillospiraceae bacterium]
MFKIGEFSKLVRVSARMLRHYEKCGLFYPAEIDPFTGYRLYSAGQITLLSKITLLRDMGFSIDAIGEILPHFDDRAYMKKALLAREDAIRAAIDTEKNKLAHINRLRAAMEKEKRNMIYDVELKALPSVNVMSLRETIKSYDAESDQWHKLMKYITRNNITCTSSGGFSIYWDEEHLDSGVDVEVAAAVTGIDRVPDPFVLRELESIPLAATVRFSGPYDGYTPAMAKLSGWIEENGYEIDGLVRGEAIVTSKDQTDPENYLTEVQVPVKKK